MSSEERKDPEKPLIKIYGDSSLSSRITQFQSKAADHEKKQKTNPFTNPNWKESTSSGKLSFDKNDPRYGRPPEGSKSEARGFKAGGQISKEILELCSIIRDNGTEESDGNFIISFGELFQIYTVISNKVVGILLRARKHGLLHFEGEMLYQRRDDNVPIILYPISHEEEV